MKTSIKVKSQKAKKATLANFKANQLTETKMKQVSGGHNVVWAI